MNTTLFKAPGQPRYGAIFMYPNLDIDGSLTAQQVADLDGESPQQRAAAAVQQQDLDSARYMHLACGVSMQLAWGPRRPVGLDPSGEGCTCPCGRGRTGRACCHDPHVSCALPMQPQPVLGPRLMLSTHLLLLLLLLCRLPC
jgi:hypothetical protein